MARCKRLEQCIKFNKHFRKQLMHDAFDWRMQKDKIIEIKLFFIDVK